MSSHLEEPAFITRDGLAQLRRRVNQLRRAHRALSRDRSPTTLIEREHLAREQKDLERRLARVIPVDLPDTVPQRVQFGVSVWLDSDLRGNECVTLVGEDETDQIRGRISWLSPLGRALNYRQVGDLVSWQQGRISISARIVAIELPRL